MAKTPAAALAFMRGIVPAARTRATLEQADIQKVIDDEQAGFTVQAWDWAFYAERVRQAKYALDESQIKPYFALNTVLQDGVFWAASQLFGLRFVERFDIPVYHPDVRVWEIFDHTGEGMALFYGDFFARESKAGGAWMGNFVEQSYEFASRPVIYNVCNYQKPANGQTALISWDDVVTLFHEFGHTLHGLFASQRYASSPAPIRRVILSSSHRKSTSTGRAIRRCLPTMPATIRPESRCRRRCAIKCLTRRSLIKVMT